MADLFGLVGCLSGRRCNAKAGTWRCRSCGVKSTSLARHLGSWPLPEFNALTVEDRQRFMASLDNLDAGSMASRATELIERFETQQQDMFRMDPPGPSSKPVGETLAPSSWSPVSMVVCRGCPCGTAPMLWSPTTS